MGPGEVTWKLRPQRRPFQEEEHEVRRPKVRGQQAGQGREDGVRVPDEAGGLCGS